ncbi:MAG: translation initiation factor [Saprospiraceae bacterium]|nr:translation initiation factor [Saprospiraceae bacterium]HRG69352.1 translation initiation factor [Saprospiraceae bacterium]
MQKKSLNSLQDLNLAYSTNKDYKPVIETETPDLISKLEQKVRVERFSKLKAGKSICRIFGLEESAETLEKLCKQIKQKCGVGGSVKDGEIIIQGDQVEKVIKILIEIGYKNTKRSGG